MDPTVVRSYYDQADVVEEYSRATIRIGLWQSEKRVFTRVFRRDDSLLDLGAGSGRIALSLYELGYRNIIGVDISRSMVAEARRLARVLEYGVPFRIGDATELGLGEEVFDGVIFGFNGLMQIPQHGQRRRAMGEIFRVLRPGGWFVFTTHDRNFERYKVFWKKERAQWRRGEQKKELDEFGDRFEPTPFGHLFIHVPSTDEIRRDLKAAGFKVHLDTVRSHIAIEPLPVREFSDECRFWVAQRPSG